VERTTVSRLVSVTSMGLTALALAGCGGGEPEAPPALTSAQANAEFTTETEDLQLAPDWTWPGDPLPSAGPDGHDQVYEPGYGRQAADHFWYCSWAATAVTSQDATTRTTALEQAGRITDTYYYKVALAADSRPALDAVLASAALGDLSKLQQDVRLNCQVDASAG
jgi:hypothetical protein